MTVTQIQRRVRKIESQSRDSESAHVEEDNLYLDVLRAIAAGADNAGELAAEALKANKLTFDRWYS